MVLQKKGATFATTFLRQQITILFFKYIYQAKNKPRKPNIIGAIKGKNNIIGPNKNTAINLPGWSLQKLLLIL